ncbi:hypothetical protein JHK84_034043 [Glycine max]|nr:hypothetical protein JHK87_033647 [Glycine soja]KAG5140275.1 hypothetical protein JHK84_034043 [Glycine max]
MGGHRGLNVLPKKRWSDKRFVATMEQLKREETRKREAELCLDRLRNMDHNNMSFVESSLQSVGHALSLPKLEDFLGDSSAVMCYFDHHHHLGVRERIGLCERREFEILTI